MALDPLKNLTRPEFHAVWDALTQYIDNQDDSCEESEWTATVQGQVNAARHLVKRMDAYMVLIGEAVK